jgi:hypothetical protein
MTPVERAYHAAIAAGATNQATALAHAFIEGKTDIITVIKIRLTGAW